MLSTIFMTIIYTILGVASIVIWMNINPTIMDNLNQKACDNSSVDKKSNIVNSVQGLYTWLTIILIISFIGGVKGIRGITDERDVYDVKDLYAILYVSGTIFIIFIASFNISSNPVIESMTTDYTLVNSKNIEGNVIPANHTLSLFLTIIKIISIVGIVGVFLKGKEIVAPSKKESNVTKDRGKEMRETEY